MSRPATQHKRATYPAYRPSGVAWLGEIPEHWEVLSFKRLGDFQGGAGFPNDEQGCEENELPFYKVSDTNLPGNEIFMTVHNNAVSRETARKLRAYIFPRETIVFAKVGAALLLNKRRILTQPACIDNNMMGFMWRTCELMWAYFWMCSLDLGELANPGAVPSINEGQIREIKIPVPSLDEQRAIAAFLDRETGRIDALIEKKRRQIELLQEKRSALMSHAVTKGLEPNAKMKDSGIEWLGDVPEHSEVRRLKYTADLINVKVDGADNDLPYTGLEHIESWTGRRIAPNGETASEGQANLYRRGDVLFSKLRPYLAKAHAAESEGICTGELLVLRPQAVAQRFLLDYVLNPDFIAVVDSSTCGAKMPRANWDYIGNLPVVIPPSEEQRAIAAFLDRETGRIDALIEKVKTSIDLLGEYRTALISAAVTGKIDVRGDAQNE